MNLIYTIFKNFVPTSKKTHRVCITKINWLMLFREIIAVYSENHTEPIHTLCGQNAEIPIVKAGGRPTQTYSYHVSSHYFSGDTDESHEILKHA
jgi:hypothetical protein